MIDTITTQSTNVPFTTTGTGTTSPSTTPSAATLNSVNKDQFLQLLVSQLKNQDPMSPMKPNEFAAQLAQFTSVEQLIQLNTAMTDQSAAVQMGTLSGQAALGASLIGRQVVADGNRVTVPATGAAQVRVEVGAGGGTGTLTIKDADGKVVATKELGWLKAGHQTIDLPGDVPAGDYTYSLSVKDAKDKSVAVATYTTGVVTAVEFNSGSIVLRLGSLKVALGDVAEVDPAPDSSTPTARP